MFKIEDCEMIEAIYEISIPFYEFANIAKKYTDEEWNEPWELVDNVGIWDEIVNSVQQQLFPEAIEVDWHEDEDSETLDGGDYIFAVRVRY